MPSTNYTGRKTDLLIFQGEIGPDDNQVSLGFGDLTKVTTGIQKLMQIFAVMFLTEKGSVPYKPKYGTDFITAVRFQRIRDESDVKANFSAAAEAVRRTLSMEANKNKPSDDERLKEAILQKFTLDKLNGKLSLFVKIVSVAGESRELFLPVPLAIL